MLSPSLAYLAQFRCWINWALVHDPLRPNKPKKVPVSPITGNVIAANDSTHHVTYEQALATGRPIGFVFTQGSGLWFLDIDNCLEANGQWSQLALYLVESLPGAAWEVSQSGTGLHGFGWASSIPEHGCKNVSLNLELYHHDRFVALTDKGTTGGITLDTSAALGHVVSQFFQRSKASTDIVDWTDEPQDGGGITDDDDELIAIMLRSGQKTAGAFFGAAHVAFADLWHADADKLGARWPSAHDEFDRSQADSALASHVAFWTAKDCERTRRIMERSALVREKWQREDYLPRTILGANRTVRNVARPRDVPPPALAGAAVITPALQTDLAASSPGPSQAEAPMKPRGIAWMTPKEQIQFFNGCVYVSALNKIFVPGDGTLQDKPRFDITYGGSHFQTVPEQKTAEKSAWEAFTRNQFYSPAVARNICFRPEIATGMITHDGLVNTYLPRPTPELAGDVAKWLNHLARLFPNEDDRAIITTYMAATIRSPGAMHQWCPVIQGLEGNGKTLIHSVMEYSIGSFYTHLARPSAMVKTANQFNSWVQGKLYVCMEEINVSEKRDFLDEIKDLITNKRIATEGKGADQGVSDNRANIIMFTNYKSAIPINRNTRRYAVFYCPQQELEDLATWGMTADYFVDLYDWLEGRNEYEALGPQAGYRIINHWLRHEAAVDARFDPRGKCQRAPRTSSTDEVLTESLGTLEQEVMEQVHAGAQGFADGWISSYHLGQLLDRMRMGKMSHSKRRDMLRTLGYVPHPGLPDGRCPAPLDGIGQRPRLYVRAGHLSLAMQTPSAVQGAYEQAQKQATQKAVTGVGNVVQMTPRT